MKCNRFLNAFVCIILALTTLTTPLRVSASLARILYVSPSGCGQVNCPCDSWANACQLKPALSAAVPNDEIWVKEGVYKPDFWMNLVDFTFVAWVFWNGGDDVNHPSRIFDFGSGTTSSMLLTPTSKNGNRISFGISRDGVGQGLYHNVMPTGQWVHVAVTLEGDTGKIYLNGATVAGSTGTITLNPNQVVGSNLWVGRSQYYDADAEFKGKIDEVAIFDRALSQQEIATVMSSGWNAMPGKVLGLHFEENPASNGTTLLDSFENGYGGVLVTNNGTANKSSPGYAGQGLSLDGGDDYVVLRHMRQGTFYLKSGVALYGGFAGTELSRDQRDPSLRPTILSGEIGKLDQRNDNSYHVITSIKTSTSTILDGFTITSGNANGGAATQNRGGGMFNVSGSPTLANLVFYENESGYTGGGLANVMSSPRLSYVTFLGNRAYYGGGISNNASNPVLTNVTFTGNVVHNGGGGMYDVASNSTLTNVTFFGNKALFGAGMADYNASDSVLNNVTFSGNVSFLKGGGMFIEASNPKLTNVTFTANSADGVGGAIYSCALSKPVIKNSILWGYAENKQDIYGSASVTYSTVQGGCSGSCSGQYNIVLDPLLGPLADNGGFTLTHALREGSPAIDAGSPDPADCPATDQRGGLRPSDGDGIGGARCDMGAVEYPGPTIFIPLIKR